MHNWKGAILNQSDSVQSAIKVLNKESLRIVLVVNNDNELVGTVTDGDIRRALTRRLSLSVSIADIMHKDPTFVLESDKKNLILSKMKNLDLLQIPIVDSNKKIVGLETLQHLHKTKRHKNPVILMAGGFGKRLQPLTNHTPKPMLKVGNKPILESILDRFIAAGFHNFYILTHYKADMVREHFGDGRDWNVTIKYIHEDVPLGTAGGLGLLPKNLPNLPILVMNGDLLTKVDFEELLDFHTHEEADATMCVREYDIQVPYGEVKSDGYHVISIEEKPVHKFFVNAGIYVLDQVLINKIECNSYLDMPNLLEFNIKNGGKVDMFPIHEYWLDIGRIEQFEKAQVDSITFSND